MNYKTKNSTRAGFTLVELLTVIVILGILAGIIIPAVSSGETKAYKAKSQSNARQIILAYNALDNPINSDAAHNNATAPYSAQSEYEWAAVLAWRADLNDGTVWFSEADELAPAIPPTSAWNKTPGAEANNLLTTNLSWTVVADLPRTRSKSTTPIIWSRGLNTDLTWDERPSDTTPGEGVWGTEGGHIGYMDGHVDWSSGAPSLVDPSGAPATDYAAATGVALASIFNEVGE